MEKQNVNLKAFNCNFLCIIAPLCFLGNTCPDFYKIDSSLLGPYRDVNSSPLIPLTNVYRKSIVFLKPNKCAFF